MIFNIFYSIVDSSKNELVVPTTTAINEVPLIYNSIKKVKIVKSINLDAYLPISLRFHQKQKEAGLSHPEFVNPLTVESRIVINGAITLEKLNRLDREPLGEIKQVLDGILEDSFWRKFSQKFLEHFSQKFRIYQVTPNTSTKTVLAKSTRRSC